MTPAAIHELGLREVARIRAAMEALAPQTGYRGSLHEVFAQLRADPANYHATRARAADRVPRARQAHRSRAGHAVPHAAAAAVRRRSDPDGARARHDDRVLLARRARRLARRLVLREPVPARPAPDLRDDGALAARVGPGPPPADRARARAARAAGVPPRVAGVHRVRRRLGALRRVARRRDGPVRRSEVAVRRADVRDVARGAAGRRHRDARAAAGRGSARSTTSWTTPRRRRSTSTNEVDRYITQSRPGARVQDRPAQDSRAARARARRGWARASTSATSTRSCSSRARCRSTCSSAGSTALARRQDLDETSRRMRSRRRMTGTWPGAQRRP